MQEWEQFLIDHERRARRILALAISLFITSVGLIVALAAVGRLGFPPRSQSPQLAGYLERRSRTRVRVFWSGTGQRRAERGQAAAIR